MYREFARNTEIDASKKKGNLGTHTNLLIKEGLHYPIILSVSKKSGKAYVFEGNHRLAALINTGAAWVPVKIQYYFFHDDNDPTLNYLPLHCDILPYNIYDWSSYPTPQLLGFIVKQLTVE